MRKLLCAVLALCLAASMAALRRGQQLLRQL